MTVAAPAGVRAVDEAAVRGVLAQVERRRGNSRLVVITAAAEWDGPEVLDTDGGPVRIVVGRSVLAVRAALAECSEEFLVVLTPLSISELGEEVQARAWRGQAQRPSPWDAVKALFRVNELDPSLRGEQWMVELLVRLAPARGYAQPTSQILDRSTAWRTLYRYGLQLPTDVPTTTDLLTWATTSAAASALDRLDEEARERIAEHLAEIAGAAAPALLQIAATGRGGDALPLGLVIDGLWPDCDPEARVLLQERHLSGRGLSDAAAADWARAAVDALQQLADNDDAAPVFTRADELLTEVDRQHTADSAVLDRTFPRRLARLGEALTAVLDEGADRLPAADGALQAVRAHVRAAREPGRVTRAEAALRLCRRHIRAWQKPAPGLAGLAGAYVEDGAWVDAARHRIAEGDSVPELVSVFERLLAVLDAERADRDRAFAAAVGSEATALPAPTGDLASTALLPIEHVLEAVLAPIGRTHPVLLLVVDGLSHAGAVPLLADVRREGWQPHGPVGSPLPPIVAALPTVTKFSRASLLTGRIQEGGPGVERDGFATHRALVDAADGQAPQLFHKSDLRPADGEIAAGVREAIADPGQRIVGVVVNGVDDFLGGGGQLRLADGLEGIPVLGLVLQAASEAGRVVVLTSDHGHILGSRQRVVSAPGGGERYRPSGKPPADDEVEVSGPRVVGSEAQVVLAAEDGVRYTPAAKHGYHGGATPAEALCPLSILVPGGVELEGWEPLVTRAPAWWDPAAAPVAVETPSATPPTSAPARPQRDDPQLSLLDEAPQPAAAAASSAAAGQPAWLEALLASPRLAAQRRLAGRVALDNEGLGVLLRVLVASGGTASGASLQRTLDLTASRLRGKLAAARTLLDVDGYQVLRIEPDGTAALNVEQLTRQFEIPLPDTER